MVYVLGVLEYVTCWSFTTIVTDLLFSWLFLFGSPLTLLFELGFREDVLVRFLFSCWLEGGSFSGVLSRSLVELTSPMGMVVVALG